MRTINDFAMMEPMKYYNNEAESVKRSEMINDKDNLYIATEKHDGDWGMFIHYSKGNNLIRSRSISKVTGVYGDYTAKVPHLCTEMDNWPDNTVVLAELCFKEYGTNANTVGTILRCLPAKAIERQKETPLYAFVFDILMFAGKDLTNEPYEKRIIEYAAEITGLVPQDYQALYFKRTAIFHDGIDFAEAADEIISAGGEGVVIQRKDNPYMPGTRTAWKTLKLKQSLPEMELKVIATIEPKKLYEGDLPETWKYWEIDELTTNPAAKPLLIQTENGALPEWKINTYSYRPVTKPYFFGWKNGITVEFNGTTCDVASGLTDADREWLATPEAAEMIKNGELYAVVKAMSENDKGRLRHPYLVRLRNDL